MNKTLTDMISERSLESRDRINKIADDLTCKSENNELTVEELAYKIYDRMLSESKPLDKDFSRVLS